MGSLSMSLDTCLNLPENAADPGWLARVRLRLVGWLLLPDSHVLNLHRIGHVVGVTGGIDSVVQNKVHGG